MQRTEVQSGSVLRADLRNGEREPALTMPPAAGAAVGRVQPPAIIIAVRAEEERIAIGILDGIMHGDNPYQTHGFDVIV